MVYNGLSRAWLNSRLNVKLWRLFGKFTLSSVWWKLLPNVKNERVYHTISGLKCGIRRTPPTSFGSQKNMWGGIFMYIFHVVRWNISHKFLVLPPQNIPGLRGGIDQCRPPNTESIPQCPRGCRAAPYGEPIRSLWKILWDTQWYRNSTKKHYPG